MTDSGFLWIQVCEQLKWHNKGSDTCIDTLNRLWQKNVNVRSAAGETLLQVPTLTEEMLLVHAEQWPLEKLASIGRGHIRARPQYFAPVIVLHWFERYFLLDGNTRVNFWLSCNNVGPHAVFRIAQKNI